MLANRNRSAARHASPEQKAILAQERMGRAYLAKLRPGKLPKREQNAYMRVAGYLCALVWRVMNDRHLADVAQPQEGELRAALRLYVERHLQKFVNEYDDPTTARPAFHRFRYIDGQQADYLAGSLAASLIRDWTCDYIEGRQRRGRNGGKNGRPRGPSKVTPDNLAALAALPGVEGMTHLERATALGLTHASEKRLWKQYKEQRLADAVGAAHAPQEAAGAPSWWGGWERPSIVPEQRRYRREFYPGERM